MIQCLKFGLGKNFLAPKNKLNKKAMSEVVSTLILVLLGLTATSLVWLTVDKVIERVQYSPELNCLDILTANPAQIKSACYNSETNETQVTIERNFNELQIKNIYFKTNSKWCCGENCPGCLILTPGATKTYFLDEETKPEEITLVLESCTIQTKDVGDC